MQPARRLSTVLAVCAGERCSALAETGPGVPASLRSAVRASEHGVLVSTPCLRNCEHAPVVALGHGSGPLSPGPRSEGAGVQIRVTTWLGPVRADELAALSRWVFSDGAESLPDPLLGVLFQPLAP